MFFVPGNILHCALNFLLKGMLSNRTIDFVTNPALKIQTPVCVNKEFNIFTKPLAGKFCEFVNLPVCFSKVEIPGNREMAVNVQLIAVFYSSQVV